MIGKLEKKKHDSKVFCDSQKKPLFLGFFNYIKRGHTHSKNKNSKLSNFLFRNSKVRNYRILVFRIRKFRIRKFQIRKFQIRKFRIFFEIFVQKK